MKKELTYKPPKGWNYCGDISLEYGGYFYKASEWGYADVIEVLPCSDAGCQDNAWWVSQGSVTLEVSDETLNSALSFIGFSGEVTDNVRVEALVAYCGIERDCQDVVQIGPDDAYARDLVNPSIRLRANATLTNFVRKWANWA
jgi:hypothetical protein